MVLFLIGMLISFGFYSCQDVIKINIPNSTPTLSVDGILSNRTLGGDTIKLSTTTNYFSNNSFSPYSGAKVMITDSFGGMESLTEVAPGKFPIVTTKPVIGHFYTLDIFTSSDHFRAVAHINRISPTLDSIKFQYQKKTIQYDTAGYYLYFFGQELKGPGDYAWIRVYKNNNLLNQPSDLFPVSDQFTDGKYYKGVGIRTHEAFQINDIARVEIWSISKDAYNYLSEIQTQINNRGIFATTPSNVSSNIINMNPFSSAKATGHFIGSLVESIEQPVSF